MGVKLKGISTVDGRTVEVVADHLEPDPNSMRMPLLTKYSYSTQGNPPPNGAQIRSNFEDAHDTTEIWVDRIDSDGVDNKFWFMQAKSDQQIYVQDTDNSDSRAVYTLIEDPIDEGDYVTFKVKFESSSGVILNGKSILFGVVV